MDESNLNVAFFGLDDRPYEEHRRLGKYRPALKTLKPFRTTRKNSSQIDNAGLFSTLTLSWLSPAIYKARKNLQYDDIPSLSKYESVQFTAPRFYQIYAEEQKKNGGDAAVVGKTLFRFIKTRFFLSVLCSCLFFVVGLIGPAIVVNQLIVYSSVPGGSVGYGIGLCFAMLVADSLRAIMYSASFVISLRYLQRAHNGLAYLIYWKLIRLKHFKQKSTGEIINLLVNDLQRIVDMLQFSAFMCGAPVGIIAGTIYGGFVLGWTTLIGVLCYVSLVPLQGVLVKFGILFRKKSIGLTDKRVKIMNEILGAIKTIKLYVWERSFEKIVGELRSREKGWLIKMGATSTLVAGIVPASSVFVSVVTLLVHTAFDYPLTAAQAFTTIVIFSTMRLAVGILPFGLRAFTESLVAIKRYNELMKMEEIEEYKVETSDKENAIELKNLSASALSLLNEDDDRSNSDKEKEIAEKEGTEKESKVGVEEIDLIHDFNLNIAQGKIVGICGAVGSGKSSLISALLGQLRITSGSVGIDGTMAYVPQQAWVFHETLRENVLFGKECDEERYQNVIRACALQPDIDILPSGDLTEIGERGINLSGGQKQRVSLARAVYSDRDIVLLDDPLSAVDAHVGKHIFWKCIRKELKGKTVLFVTHQLQYLKHCDLVVMLKDGRIAELGTHDKLMDDEAAYADLIGKFHGGEKDENVENRSEATKKKRKSESDYGQIADSDNANKEQESLMRKEEQEFGSVSWKTYKTYFKAMGGLFFTTLILLIAFLHIFSVNATTYWITYWINIGGKETCFNTSAISTVAPNVRNCIKDPNLVTNPNIGFYQMVYGCILLGSGVFLILRVVTLPWAVLRASSVMHGRLFATILRCPMEFFDRTPMGQLLNRFSRDLDEMDSRLVSGLNSIMQLFSLTIISFVTICLVFPIFVVVFVVLAILFGILLTFYRSGMRDFKRYSNVSRSPWISHVAATTHGLPSIHAYQKEGEFLKKFSDHVDVYSVPFLAYLNSMVWVATRLDAFTIVVNFIVAIFVVVGKSHPEIFGVSRSTASAGLALTYAVQSTGLLNMFCRLFMESETFFTSVERVREYSELKNLEAERVIEDSRPPKDWPKHGAVKFDQVRMRYRDDLPEVLKGISFEIKPKEKIGIVGRTGSGKSSLGVVLFRLVEVSGGSIQIDGVDIHKIGLEDLRKKLTIIPQDPTLFEGTVRYNLDPFHKYSDEKLWTALEQCHAKKLIQNLPDKLESEVVENGENFSVGERQLLCMARAILRHSKIIMLDEATAAIDSETDSLVQDTIREAFTDCTMLTIAHRLNTVLTCDKILVMDDGKIAEFGEPASLLNKPDSQLAKMVSAAENLKIRNAIREQTNPTPPFSSKAGLRNFNNQNNSNLGAGQHNKAFVPDS